MRCVVLHVYTCMCLHGYVHRHALHRRDVYTPSHPPHRIPKPPIKLSAQQEHKRQLEALQAELTARTEAFDLYRARSHTTLKKLAAGQQGAEDRVAGVQVRGFGVRGGGVCGFGGWENGVVFGWLNG